MAALEVDGEFAEQLFVHGLGVQCAEGMAEWLHARVRAELGIGPARGDVTRGAIRPARSSPSTRRSSVCSTREQIGLRLSDGFAIEPEQSTWRSSPTIPRRSTSG